MQRIVVYPGTFDPITNGHVDLIERATHLFDQVIVGVARNQNKTPHFSLEERVAMVAAVARKCPSVSVLGFDTLLVDFMRLHQAHFVLRGLRTVSDFDYESQLAGTNQLLAPDIDTVFLMPSREVACVSSQLIREIAALGGDVSPFVPPEVISAWR